MKEELIEIRKIGEASLRHYLIRSLSKAREEVTGDKEVPVLSPMNSWFKDLWGPNRRRQVCCDCRTREREGELPDRVGSSWPWEDLWSLSQVWWEAFWWRDLIWPHGLYELYVEGEEDWNLKAFRSPRGENDGLNEGSFRVGRTQILRYIILKTELMGLEGWLDGSFILYCIS